VGDGEDKGFKWKDGEKVKGFAILGKKPDELTVKRRGESSPQWQMADWSNTFLMNWKKWDWLQLLGATFFTLSLATKMAAPFTEKKVNLDELSAHSAVGLATASDEVRGQQTAEVAAHLLEMRSPTGLKMLPEAHKQGLAKTFADIADTLYLRHEQDVTKSVEPKKEAPAVAAQTSMDVAPAPQASAHAADLRDKLKEARERGEGAFAAKFGQHDGMALAATM
jgi:hypothetical protein